MRIITIYRIITNRNINLILDFINRLSDNLFCPMKLVFIKEKKPNPIDRLHKHHTKNKVRKICELLFCFILIPSLYEDLEIIATSPYLCIAIYMKKNQTLVMTMMSIKQEQANSIAAHTNLQTGTGTIGIEVGSAFKKRQMW